MSFNGDASERCRGIDDDLSSVSGDINADAAELKASRQVISLLQRRIEEMRLQMESLEQLFVDQAHTKSSPPKVTDGESTSANEPNSKDNNQQGDSAEQSDELIDVQPSHVAPKDMLLGVIRNQLYAKDEEIARLKMNLAQLQSEKNEISVSLKLLQDDVETTKSESAILRENLALRDQTIVSLSNELFEQTNLNDMNAEFNKQLAQDNLHGTQQSSQKHIAKLIDSLEAHKKTNELLSKNVAKLTERCAQAEQREIETRSQCHELEAKCCQVQSKLLSLLKEIEQSSKPQLLGSGDCEPDASASNHADKNQEVIFSESVKQLIKRLLEDKSLDIPLSWKEGNKPKKPEDLVHQNGPQVVSAKYECDELGFYIETSEICDDSSPRSYVTGHEAYAASSSQFSNFEDAVGDGLRSENSEKSRRTRNQVVFDAARLDESRWHNRWDDFIKDFDKVELRKSKEFKALLRSGVPQEYRCKIWKALIDLRMHKERQDCGPEYFQSLLEPNRPNTGSKKTLNPSSKQIELDLLRTLPNNKHFENPDSSGTVRLRRVLTAYAERNPKVGYCQGMNRLAAVALLILPEEEAFWCLVAIVENIMPAGYYNDLWLAQVDSSVVMDYLSLKIPNLSEHFKKHSVDLSLFAWFLTIFVDGMPSALFLRLWDSFLYEGDKILFRVALAMLKMYEPELLKLDNSVAISNFLRSSVNEPFDLDKFFDIAFNWINPLSSRSLQSKRKHNLEQMKAGFEGIQSSTPDHSPTISTQDKDDDSPHEDNSIISI